MKGFFTTLFICLCFYFSYAAPPDSLTPPAAHFRTEKEGSGVKFIPTLPTLNPIPGGRMPFYSYLWNFGDGHFSFKKNPVHAYDKAGSYTAHLYVVNNYDDGPRPGRGSRKVLIAANNTHPTKPTSAEKAFFSANGIFQLNKNTNALPGQQMTVIAGVKHKGKGHVFLLLNEKDYANDGLAFMNQTTYNDENILPTPELKSLQGMWASVNQATLTFSGSPDYGIKKQYDFKEDKRAVDYFRRLFKGYKTISDYEVSSQDSTAQFSFINLMATPSMWVDTNAIITITGVFIPEGSGRAIIHKMEVPIVASHDPNKMAMKHACASYRTLFRKKKLIYKVEFQNDGKGDAENIWLNISLPKQTDATTFNLIAHYPYCDSCQSKNDKGCWELYPKGEDTLVFHFKDISLPGSQAEDIGDPDSTKGFIKFSVSTDKKLKNKPFPAKTLIYFDKNDPIATNTSSGRFRWGLSPIIFLGYSGFMPQLGHKGLTYKEIGDLGFGIAPIAPYKKPYFQFEIYGSLVTYYKNVRIDSQGVIALPTNPDKAKQPRRTEFQYYTRSLESKDLKIRVVPLHVRYNFTNFLSAGVGLLADFRINLSTSEDRTYFPVNVTGANLKVPEVKKHFDNWKNAPGKDLSFSSFVDVAVGRAYLGPSLGLRYYYWGTAQQHLNLYIAWRF